jgi:hypothetical protein
MTAVLKYGSAGSLAALVLAAGLGWLVDGSSGMWGGILGIAIPVGFFSITVIVALLTLRVRPEIFGAAILGSWILKLIALIAVLALLSNADFYNKSIFFIAFLVGTIGYLVGEAAIVMKTRVPYIEPQTPQSKA